jgi:histidinol-phosphate phosphatase family protein
LTQPKFDIVIPTAGRPSLERLLGALVACEGPRPRDVIVIRDDDGHGPARARNRGWRRSTAEWIAFLDDDVVPERDWLERLAEDLAGLAPSVAGSQGRIRVPRPEGRRPTDWERNVAGLETALWATADMAYRRSVLVAVGGFDERFGRAYREDADLALRVRRAGYELARGRRTVVHPVRPAGALASVRAQAGNADDALMRALHGPDWREAASVPRGRLRRHVATTAAGGLALAGALGGRRRLAALGLAGWLAGTGELAGARIAPGPRTQREVATMLLTSALLPPAAVYHRLAGRSRARRLLADPNRPPRPEPPAAVLLDRDGTLVEDVPYNGEPERVAPMPDARAALDRLRRAGIPVAVVSNQSGVARGLVTAEQVDAVNRRVEELLGPFAAWAVCPHGPDEGCACRKPSPGLVLETAGRLGVEPAACVLIGDIGSDVEAARAAGARAILVPTAKTRREEIEAAPQVAPTLMHAVELVLGGAA